MNDEERNEPPPPTPELVAERAIILSVVSCRGFVESDRQNPKGAADLASRAYTWLRDLGLASKLSGWERRVLDTPIGALADQDRVDASWLSEAAVVLAWSLGRYSLPAFDEQCDPAGAANSLGFLGDRNNTVLSRPNLRTDSQLREFNEFVYNVHWRLRDHSIARRGYDFEALALKAWGMPIARFGLKLMDKDIQVGARPLSIAPESEWRTLLSITQERHRASNWTIGYASEDFYEVTTDT